MSAAAQKSEPIGAREFSVTSHLCGAARASVAMLHRA
jgi:hypothetical protein